MSFLSDKIVYDVMSSDDKRVMVTYTTVEAANEVVGMHPLLELQTKLKLVSFFRWFFLKVVFL